ncbi:RHS repeat-associated core domain-containing protein [uncultured Aquimarina sp.]|uniref:RHS repeat-associated core domain-containing protein n=1 Tax=uncultured Aquimarina sp. TaxID=575652 RepID=UPI0026147F63|nr:RHS repeat-associated core domain-containing protein [uncultured Aquimarina sp.]
MLLASKHFTPVIGIDIHIVIIPPGVPVPIPHPYIGMVVDPMDYVPIIGSTVNVNCVPKGNSGTAGMIGTMIHIPMGGPFAMAPMIGHDSMNFFGSTKVSAEDAYFTPAGYMTMTCNDIGMPLSLTPGKKMKPIPSLYLPSSMSIPLPMGKPVNVGGPYAPDLLGMLMALVMSYGFGALMKGAGKLAKKGLTKLNHALPATSGLKKKMCKMGFEPVDLITGRMVYEGEDFSIGGSIPIRWERNWYSDSGYEGMMGHGMHCNYDLALHIDYDEDAIVMRLPDGRITSFPLLVLENESSYNRTEKLTLTFIDGKTYEITDHESQQIYTFTKYTDTLYKPTTLRNPEGFKIQFIYNAIYRLEQIIDTAGRKIDLDLDEENRVTKVTARHQGESRTLIQYVYNEDGDLIEIIDALDQVTMMEYKNHLMIKKTDRNGQAFYWKYDGKTTGARCIETWGDEGILSGTIEYNKGYNLVTNSLGQESIYYFNNLNLCTQVTDPLGDNIFHEYTPYMEPYRDIDEEGNITGYSYDERGNLTGLHQPDGSVIGFVYDEKDRLVLSKDPSGGSVVKTFDNDRLHAVIGLDGGVTSFEYNKQGLINEVRDNAGNRTKLDYDEDHNLHELTLPNGAKSSWEYDPWGRCLHTRNSEDHQQQFFYDELDRIYQIRQADANIIKLKYNAYDEVIQTVDQKKREVNFDYTPMGSLKMREENSRKIYFKYDTEEQLNTITNEHNEFYRFSRNEKGEIIREIGFDGLTRKYDRDRAGKVLRVNRPDDKFTEYEYDLNGRITRAEHSDGTWETYSYDLNGNLIEAINEHSRVQLIRDKAGRIIAENQDEHIVESKYDSLSNRINITSSLGANIALSRNKLGLIEEMNASVPPFKGGEGDVNTPPTSPQGKAKIWNAQFSHNSLGMEVERILPGGITNHIEYDHAGRPIQHKVTAGNRETRHRTYTWNVNDRLTKMVNGLTNGVVTYSYDEFNSLAGARYENKQFDYKLPDEVGNLYRTEGKGDRKYGTGGQLQEADGNKFKYDAEGNLITKITNKGNWDYEWYGNGILKKVVDPKNNSTEFEYDALGRRTAKINHGKGFSPSQGEMSTSGGQRASITRFVWDGNVPLHEWKYDLNQRPELVVDEYGMLKESKPEPIENLITWIFDEGTFKPAAKITEDDSYSIITDYLGTPVEMYNSQGEKTWQVEYDIYGKVRKLAKGSLEDCPFRYQGQYEDVETGLYYNGYRYYSCDTGIYISQDPIGLNSREYNLYTYVSDTNSTIDPLGLDWNYVLEDSSGNPYYHGRASDNQSMKDVGRRHSKTKGTDGARFGKGDKMRKVTPVKTPKDAVRGVEQRGVDEGDLLGRNSDKARGNKINGMSEAKQKTTKGKRRLKAADKLLDGKKPSQLPSLDELEFKDLGCK